MRKLALLLLFAVVAGCHSAAPSRNVAPDEAEKLLINRNWLDHMPKSETERLHVFRFVPNMGGGVFQDRTLYAGQFELFTFERTGEQIRFDLPHTGEKKTVGYTIEALDDGQDGLDLKLTLDGSPRGPSVYYGMRRESAADLDASLRTLINR
jgi:hypothetical protein